MITNNLNFKGYKNVLCAFDVPISRSQSVTYISMQLNNEDGYNDLTEYRKIKGLQGDVLNQKYGDVLMMSYFIDKDKREEHIFFDTKDMYWGDELRELSEKYVPSMMTKEEYKFQENLHMKVYTLLASLTRRMQFDSFDNEDRGRFKVIERMFKNFYSLFNKQECAFRLTEIACLKKVKFQNVAVGFNNGIMKTMERFFR